MAKLLEIENLNKAFKSVPANAGFALRDVSFSLDGGYIMGFVGQNGAGKTTTIKTLMNILVKDSGQIRLFGMDNVQCERDVKERIGFVSDDKMFYEDVTVLKMKKLVAPFYRNWDDDLFLSLVKRFELKPHMKLGKLSQGMYKKFALAMALSHKPDLLILDEPTSGLDPPFRVEFLDILREFIQDESKGVLFSTHITSDLDKIADYVTLIHDGQIVFSESKEELLENRYVVKGSGDMAERFKAMGLTGVTSGSYSSEGLCHGNDCAGLLAGEGCVVEKPTIEDIMLFSVRGERNAKAG